MNDKVKAVLSGIIEQFKTGDIPQAITVSMFPFPDLPSSNWSLLNRTIQFISGTMDARGFRQWKNVDRYVKKGSKAIFILVPLIKKIDDKGEEKQILRGFTAKPVFRVEDTDGEDLEYQQIELPDLPLIDRAKGWGLSIKAIPGNYRYYGYFSSSRKEIALASDDESVFFHELAHAAHEKIMGKLKGGQDPLQEIIAELSAATLCRMVGKRTTSLGNSYQYIDNYASKLDLSAHSVCLKVMAETEKVLSLILVGETVSQEQEIEIAA